MKRILGESLDLLTQAFMHPILAQFPNADIKDLFTMEYYSHLIGMLEMYDNTIGIREPDYVHYLLIKLEIQSPLQKYIKNLEQLSIAEKDKVSKVLLPLRDRVVIMKQEQEDGDGDEHDHDHDEDLAAEEPVDEDMEGTEDEEAGEEEVITLQPR